MQNNNDNKERICCSDHAIRLKFTTRFGQALEQREYIKTMLDNLPDMNTDESVEEYELACVEIVDQLKIMLGIQIG